MLQLFIIQFTLKKFRSLFHTLRSMKLSVVNDKICPISWATHLLTPTSARSNDIFTSSWLTFHRSIFVSYELGCFRQEYTNRLWLGKTCMRSSKKSTEDVKRLKKKFLHPNRYPQYLSDQNKVQFAYMNGSWKVLHEGSWRQATKGWWIISFDAATWYGPYYARV